MALAQDMLAGAQLVNMGWQRQERMQELRAQQAMQQMQERHLAAQAQYLTEQANQIQFKMQQEQEDDATLMATQQLYQNRIRLGEDPAKVQAELDASLMYANPRAFEKISRAREYQDKARQFEREQTDKERHEKVMEAAAMLRAQRTGASKSSEDKPTVTEKDAQNYASLKGQKASLETALQYVKFGSKAQEEEVRSNLEKVNNELSFYDQNKKMAVKELGEAEKIRLKSLYDQLERTEAELDKKPDVRVEKTSFFGLNEHDKPLQVKAKREHDELVAKRDRIAKEIESLSGSGAPKETKGRLRLGQIVVQRGVKYRYQGGPEDDPSSFVPMSK